MNILHSILQAAGKAAHMPESLHTAKAPVDASAVAWPLRPGPSDQAFRSSSDGDLDSKDKEAELGTPESL